MSSLFLCEHLCCGSVVVLEYSVFLKHFKQLIAAQGPVIYCKDYIALI